MRLDYEKEIKESLEELHELERKHRHTHVGQRLQLLRLLKHGTCRSVAEAAKVLGYSSRQCLRWLKQYREEELEGLLQNRIAQRGRRGERMTEAAWAALNEALVGGEIGSYRQARMFLEEQGVVYRDESSIYRLFKRHRIKAKVGRYRHQKADPEVQEGFKKTSLSS